MALKYFSFTSILAIANASAIAVQSTVAVVWQPEYHDAVKLPDSCVHQKHIPGYWSQCVMTPCKTESGSAYKYWEYDFWVSIQHYLQCKECHILDFSLRYLSMFFACVKHVTLSLCSYVDKNVFVSLRCGLIHWQYTRALDSQLILCFNSDPSPQDNLKDWDSCWLSVA